MAQAQITAAGQQPPSEDQIVSSLLGKIEASESPPEPTPAKAQTPAAEEPAASEAPADETPAPETDQEEPAKPEKAAEESSVEIDPDAKWIEVEEVTEGGTKETRKYSLNELKAQRMMQADYSRKTAELARQRESAQAETRQAVETERQKFVSQAQTLQRALVQMVAPEFAKAGVDLGNQMSVQSYLSQLAKEDPAQAIAMQNRLQELHLAVSLAGKAVETEQAKSRTERGQQIATQAREAWENLGRNIKGWNQETYNKLLKTGMEHYGFRAEEIANPVRADGTLPDGYLPAVDARFIQLLHDADAYRQQQSAQPIVEKRVAAVPKVIKPGTNAKPGKNEREAEDQTRLRKTGKIEDFARLLERWL